jgi:hypothetical protein
MKTMKLALLTAICIAAIPASGEIAPDQQERLAKKAAVADVEFKNERREDLHSSKKIFDDGAKGFEYLLGPPHRPLSGRPEFATREEEMLFQSYCFASTILRARNIGSDAVLLPRKDMIVTNSTFAITGVLKPAAGIQVGTRISVMNVGGEMVDKGSRLRVHNHQFGGYKVGQEYILILNRIKGSDELDFRSAAPVIDVANERIYPVGGKWEVFRAGTEFETFASELRRAGGLSTCVSRVGEK